MSISRKPLVLLAVLALAAGGTVSGLLLAGGADADPPEGDASQPTAGLACATDEPTLSNHSDFTDLPGGPLTSDAAMAGWLEVNSFGLKLEDLDVITAGNSNPLFALYEYQAPEGPIARFSVNLRGDSWAVTDWLGCSSKIADIIRLEAPE